MCFFSFFFRVEVVSVIEFLFIVVWDVCINSVCSSGSGGGGGGEEV